MLIVFELSGSPPFTTITYNQVPGSPVAVRQWGHAGTPWCLHRMFYPKARPILWTRTLRHVFGWSVNKSCAPTTFCHLWKSEPINTQTWNFSSSREWQQQRAEGSSSHLQENGAAAPQMDTAGLTVTTYLLTYSCCFPLSHGSYCLLEII